MGGRSSRSGMASASRLTGLEPVRSINEDWAYQPDPGVPVSDLRMNPISYVGIDRDAELDNKFVDLVNEKYQETVVTKVERNASVRIDDLKTLQPFITQSGFDRAMRGEAGMGNPVKVVSYKGQLYLMDGNHRAVAAKMQGNSTIRATIYTRVDR